jgi:Flp pilus assembly protein TadD
MGLVTDLRNDAEWRFASGSAIAHRVPARTSSSEIETCAPCHARRSQIAPPDPEGRFLDAYRPALLDQGLYHADGQILDEVYVWGSFLQSRMYAAGVVCSDCHDPHGLRIEAPDAACARCHQNATFATPAHHHHQAESPGASCVTCHMPARTYMVVDARRDHSFRVPRPDLSVAIGVPNACTDCHPDRPTSWAAEASRRWYGSERSAGTHYAEVLDAGRRGAPDAGKRLAALSQDTNESGIVRATALRLLSERLEPQHVESVRTGLSDPDALVRMAAASAAEALPPRERRLALEPLLLDTRRAVRIEAARALAPLREQMSGARQRHALDRALEEYRSAQLINADRPESHVNLGIMHTRLGSLHAAEREYEEAIRIGPFFVPAYVNLAELYRMEDREGDGERVLRKGLEQVPDSAALHHALGLLLVRQQQANDALEALGRATEFGPETPRYAYVYGVALYSAGESRHALDVLARGHQAHPGDPDLLVALATLNREMGELEAATLYAEKLLELRPEDPATRSLLRELNEARLGPALTE